ncbi:MAG: transglycosylase domain-containing protein [Actinomycetota bacterium]|nr:transglycosylase domain-containing protein [Actinomycetota bacterium]
MPVGSPGGGHRPGWRPGSPLPVPGGPSQRSAPPGPGPGYSRRQHEPELLTHVDRIDRTPPSSVDAVGNHGGSSEGGGGNNRGGNNRGASNQRQRGWRRFRHVVLVACLLGVLVPIAAFLVGWVVYDVPPPAALSAERKQVTTLYYSDGQTEIGRYVPEEGNRTEVPLDRVPLHVQDAVLAAEDRSFRSNPGFDIIGISRAAWKQLTGGSGGGSTITQQYVKVATGDDAVSYLRKYREVIVAAKMTKENSKDQILEDYLNTIYFGRGAYGVQAASQAYFGKDVQDLSVSEGAMLAGVIQSPSRSDPAKNLDQAQARWNFVLDGMMAEGWLPATERATLQFPITLPPDKAVPGSPSDDRAHIIDKALAELEAQGFSRDQLAVNGGRVVTTVDAGAQEAARDAVLTELDGQPENLHSSLVAINPRSGGVVAYYGGQDGVGFDLAGGPAWNPGSSFKPFAMLAALEQGIGANAVFNGTSPLEVGGVEYSNSESASFNALTLREAMTQSVNTTFVQLTDEVGADAVRDAAISAGIPAEIEGRKSLVEADNQQPGLGITLGQYPVHTIDMASAYATFANDGMRNEPFFVREYVDSDGAELYEHRPDPQPAFDESDLQRNTQLARNVTATLTGVADASGTPLDGGREVAAKTGTHQLGDTGSNAAAWMIGYTPSISTAVWVGDPANTAIVNAGGEDVFGRGLPGQIWQRFMDDYLEDREEETFPPVELLGGAAGPAADEMVSQNADNGGPETTETPLPPGEPAPGSDAELTETDDVIGDCFPFDCGDLEPEPTDAVEPQPGRPPRDGDELPAPPEPGASPKD